MIPADVASRIQLAADVALRPVAPSQEITDKLSDLVPGQRIMAEIQSLLPNGTYRAIINQRDITLALPFSAKAGDALELEVVNSDGKLTLAVISRPPTNTTGSPIESVPTTLSRTGQLISNLLGKAGNTKAETMPTPLNNGQPIASAPPRTAQDLIPLLKQAITQSGMFYESHQAAWVNGWVQKSNLLQEPQGQLSPSYQAGNSAVPDNVTLRHEPQDKLPPTAPAVTPRPSLESMQRVDTGAEPTNSRTTATPPPLQGAAFSQLIAPETLPLVQQQLEALATQNFSWQGQVWPNQQMRWEIDEEAPRGEQGHDEADSNWQTRLHLALPNLGGVDARIRLQGNQISLVLAADNAETRRLLQTSTETLRSQLDEAGLALAAVGIEAVKEPVPDDKTAI